MIYNIPFWLYILTIQLYYQRERAIKIQISQLEVINNINYDVTYVVIITITAHKGRFGGCRRCGGCWCFHCGGCRRCRGCRCFFHCGIICDSK